MRAADNNKNSAKILRAAGRIFIVLGVAVLGLLIFFDIWIKPTLDKVSVYQCERIADRAVSEAICAHMAETGEAASSLVDLIYDDSGRIQALKTDPIGINRLKAMLTEFIDNELSASQSEEVGISLGTLTGISYLYGRGSELIFSVRPTGAVQTHLLCSFEEAGINQTMHSIILQVDTVISPLIPGFTDRVTVTTEFVLAQTILIGEVPETFSRIILDEGAIGELADFNLTGD